MTYRRYYADSRRIVYSMTSVGITSWVQIITATVRDIDCIMVFDSSGETMELGIGPESSEQRALLIPPGGFSGPVPLAMPVGTRVSIRAVSTGVTAGELIMTGLT
jgi:hypothetical protein